MVSRPAIRAQGSLRPSSISPLQTALHVDVRQHSRLDIVRSATCFCGTLWKAVRAMDAGDLLMFTDWRGDPDERLDADGTEVGALLSPGGRVGR